jgi:hypothetical protein
MPIVKRVSYLTNVTHEMDIDCVTQEDVDAWLNAGRGRRKLVQEAFPFCNSDEREFILTGITKEEWDAWEVRSEGA